MIELKNIQQQKQFKILLIGDDCLDVYQYGTVDRISPEAPVPVFKYSYKEERPGMARNVKANLENLGCSVDYLSGKTSVKTRLIDIRSKQQIVRIDEDEQSQPITINTALPMYDAVVVSDYNKGAVSYELVENLLKEFKGPLFVDSKKQDLKRFEGCIIKINQYEYSQLVSAPNNETDLVVTYGDHGVVWGAHAFAAKKVEVADVCGAGDTFLSALCYQYLNTNNMIESIKFAIAAGAVSVQHLGCYAPKLEEVL
jgi:bifunctional ADP-heptose synthase (sugar kinase/adenylyltransferase)